MIWNERARPCWQMRCGGRPWIVAPLRRTVPLSGGNRPETRLNSVVLPAPFGPISAWISPACDRRGSRSRPRGCRRSCFETPLDLEHRSLRRLRAQECRQRQALVDLAPAHRRRFFRRRPPAPAAAWPRCRRGRPARTARSRRRRGRTRAASSASRSRTARGTGCRTATPSAGPRMWCMPPITTIASNSPENGTETASAETR